MGTHITNDMSAYNLLRGLRGAYKSAVTVGV